jgi:HEAT repeats/TIR domain/HEAT repeat
MLEDSDCYVRRKATEALGKIKSEVSISKLLSMLEDEDFFVRTSAAEALSKISSPLVIQELQKLLQHHSSDVRGVAAKALGYLGDDAEIVIPNLLKLICDEDWAVRTNIVEALGSIATEDSEDVITALTEALKDPSIHGRTVISLGKIGCKLVIPELFQALKMPSRQWSASIALGEYKNDRAAHILPDLHTLLLTQSSGYAFDTIQAIQSNCKYYNYEIAHNLVPPGKSIALYFSSAPSDADLQTQLANHLNLLERQEIITSWHHRQMLPGDERTQVINQQLNTADIILLLISADSIADHTCYDLEIQQAMARHQAGEARVIPILLRPVDWQGAPFSQLPVLPRNHQPVTSWSDRHAAFQEIAEGIREVAIDLRKAKREERTGNS